MLFVKGPKPATTVANTPANSNRAVKELKGFYKVALKAAGAPESGKRITLPLRVQDLRHWEGDANGRWVIDAGTYTILVGSSGADADLTLQSTFTID